MLDAIITTQVVKFGNVRYGEGMRNLSYYWWIESLPASMIYTGLILSSCVVLRSKVDSIWGIDMPPDTTISA